MLDWIGMHWLPIHLCDGRVFTNSICEAQGKGRAKGRPRKVTQRSFIDGGWWMVDGGYPFPDALH